MQSWHLMGSVSDLICCAEEEEEEAEEEAGEPEEGDEGGLGEIDINNEHGTGPNIAGGAGE
jgi:hypothetical protein